MYDKTAVIKTKKLNFFCFYLLSLCDDDNEAVKGYFVKNRELGTVLAELMIKDLLYNQIQYP